MRISIMLLLILLTVTACGTQQNAAPITQPVPVVIPGNTPVAEVSSSGGSAGTASVCSCPTSIAPPAKSQIGSINPPAPICNCPAIIIQPTEPVPGVELTPQGIPANGITLTDNGKTFIMHSGENFLLNLGADIFDWTVQIDNQNVLDRVKNIMVMRGAQGVYEANSPGQAVLTASGDPFCRKSTPACMAPSMLFQITVIVQ
jgi:hypothetical protein